MLRRRCVFVRIMRHARQTSRVANAVINFTIVLYRVWYIVTLLRIMIGVMILGAVNFFCLSSIIILFILVHGYLALYS